MYFLGCIGYLLDGSGLKELMCSICAPVSVDKMLQGRAFARAVRGHLLIQTVLSNIILEQLDISAEEQKAIDEVITDFQDESPSLSSLNQNPHLVSLAKKMENKLAQLKKNGLTAMLWVLYLILVNLVKECIHAELSGYFMMRRTDRFWTGVWSDLTIEHTFMRSMKPDGVPDSVVSKWLLGLTATYDICMSFEEFCGVNFSSSEQHEDFRESRKAKDSTDIAKVSLWFESRSPFPVTDEIMSVATGVVGDNTITCYDALAVGKQAMTNMVVKHFTDVKLMTCSVKFYYGNVVVDPFLIFQMISISKQTDDDLKTYLQHELAPFSLTLFDEAGMRKTIKSALYEIFEEREKNVYLHNF
ncbi:hypothetical protein PR048_019531 [Dryococelus australis]|uniref:Uncharacterized protein n=1 Tax=Dryococelus australis TaxID=614101 RepID=A0ABQ9H3P9_9NEOP|nr:hypothetical protein PR048_019531 [Dryococelus australis]